MKTIASPGSAKSEDVGFRVPLGKGHHHSAVSDLTFLTNELVHAAAVEHPVSLVVHVDTSGRAWRLAVEHHSKWDRTPFGRENQMSVACVEPHGNTPATFVEHDLLPLDRPAA